MSEQEAGKTTSATSSSSQSSNQRLRESGAEQLSSLPARKSTFRVAMSNPRVWIPSIAVIILIVLAIIGPTIAPHDPLKINSADMLQGPSSTYWAGTDDRGRDLLSRTIVGTRTSMIVAIASVVLATIIGVTFGLVGGYFGGFWEFLTMRTVDVLLTFPPILLAIVVVAFLGPNMRNLIGVIAVLYMTRFARITFGSVSQVKQREFVEAARVVGAGNARILLRYILPNITAPIFVQISLTVGFAILLESGLSFLGLGTPPPAPSWGNMISAARSYMQDNPAFVLMPSLMISVAILAFNTLGDGLRDSLDPRLRQ